jgi:hypothetical protein
VFAMRVEVRGFWMRGVGGGTGDCVRAEEEEEEDVLERLGRLVRVSDGILGVVGVFNRPS